MKRMVALCLLLLILSGCRESSQSSLSETTSSPSPTQLAEPTVQTITQSQESPSMRISKVEEITGQSFQVDLESWGKVRFVSAKSVNGDGTTDLQLTLKDLEGNQLYTFPNPKIVEGWDFYSVKAISFKDVNQDGKKDVIVLADYLTGIGSEGSVPFTVPMIYIQKGKEFLSDYNVDNSLSKSGKVNTIDDVVTYFNLKLQSTVTPTPVSAVQSIEEVNKRLCNYVLASNLTEDEIIHAYYTEYTNQKLDQSEAGQDQMFGYLGECFEQEMDKQLANHSELNSKVEKIYKTLGECIAQLSTIDYIRNGGGTMWGHNGNRELGLYKYYMNTYVKMKQKGPSATPGKYEQLANTLDSQMDKLKSQGVKGLEEFLEPKKVKEAEKDFETAFLRLKEVVQRFKELTAEKDEASLFLLQHVVDRVGYSINE